MLVTLIHTETDRHAHTRTHTPQCVKRHGFSHNTFMPLGLHFYLFQRLLSFVTGYQEAIDGLFHKMPFQNFSIKGFLSSLLLWSLLGSGDRYRVGTR